MIDNIICVQAARHDTKFDHLQVHLPGIMYTVYRHTYIMITYMTGSFKIIAATNIYSLGMENKQSVFRLRLKTSGIIIDRGNTGSIILLYRVTCIDHCTLYTVH